ncbi:MAG: phosphatidate cytidylyltransferase [Chloroflexi bacterium]|nr:phosphatidate cytidylyltransferase [Chloroflexota bacterium]
MLSQRAFSAAIGLAVLVYFLLKGQPWFSFLVALTAFIAVREFYRLVLSEQPPLLRLFGQVWTVLLVLAPLSGESYASPLLISSAVGVSLVIGLFHPGQKALLGWTWNLAGIFYVGWLLSHYSLLMDLDKGREFVALLLFTTFACDTASFITGAAFGRNKMAPVVSPRKTWEGATAGFLAAVGASYLIGTLLELEIGYPHLLTLGALVGVLAQVGDLAESMIKRSAGVKDTGNLMRGHGGLLDRIDGVLFVGAGGYYYIILLLL